MVGLQAAEIERIFSALAADPSEPGVKLLASLEPPRVLWANKEAAALLGSSDPAQLTRVIFGRTATGRPLVTRLGRLTPASNLHLERLTVADRFRPFGLVLACRAVPYRVPKTVFLHTPTAGAIATTRLNTVPLEAAPGEPILPAADQVEPPRAFVPATADGLGVVLHEPPPESVEDTGAPSEPEIVEILPGSDSEVATDVPTWDAVPAMTFDYPVAAVEEQDLAPVEGHAGAIWMESGAIPIADADAADLVTAQSAEPAAKSDGVIPAPSDSRTDGGTGPIPDRNVVERIWRSLETGDDTKAKPFREIAGAAASKVVHLANFKAVTPLFSGKAQPRREPPRAVPETPPPEPLDAPKWAEAPTDEALAQDQKLSSHERFNFDEIARALAVLPGADVNLHRATGAERLERMATPAVPARDAEADEPRRREAWQLLDALPLGVLVTQDERVGYANKAFLELLGYASLEDLRTHGGLAGLFKDLSDHSAAPADAKQEMVLRARNGRDLKVETRLQTITWASAPAVLLTVRRPERDPARARPETLNEDSRLADLEEALDLATAGVGFLDAQGRIQSLNGGAARLFGYEIQELVGDSATVLFAQDEQVAWRSFFADFASRDEGRRSAFRKFAGRRRNGRSVPVALSLRRVARDRICIVWQESWHGHAGESELEVLRREAERASALKSEFLAQVSHEVRTPLNAILGFTEIILEERFGPVANERYREYLRDIHTSGTHVVSLINDLLDLSRIEQGALDLDLVAVDVNAVLSACVATLQGQAHRERVVIRTSLTPRSPVALTDQRAFRQIVLNLLSNAVKFNEPGGQVIVSSATSEPGQVVIRIRDTGPGMSAAEIETAMKPFRQLATPKASAGSGLGLPLTKAMVEASQGTLRITSRQGEGTLVEVTLQSAAEAALSVPAE